MAGTEVFIFGVCVGCIVSLTWAFIGIMILKRELQLAKKTLKKLKKEMAKHGK